MKNKIALIGCGNVGICYLYALLCQKVNINEIVVIDINDTKVEGEIIDFQHSLPFVNMKTKIYLGTYDDCSDAKIVVITAGARQVPGESRMDLIYKNAKLFKDMIKEVVNSGFDGIFLNATNPLDVMTYLIYKYSNFDASKVIGSGTELDTARLKYYLQELYHANYSEIEAYVLGEHGDSSFVPWSNIIVKNELVSNTLFNKDQLERKERNSAYTLLNTKGYSSSAIGLCLASITTAIINDEKKEFCISNYDAINDTYYGYPAIVGKDGVIKRVNLKITSNEEQELQKSINVIKTAIDEVK